MIPQTINPIRDPKLPNRHELKCIDPYFDQVCEGKKKFEYRKDDRGYEVGDILVLRQWDRVLKEYSGWACKVRVTHILRPEPRLPVHLPQGFCIMSIEVLSPALAREIGW